MLKKLKEEVYKANMLLPKYGLVTFTWGNVSAFEPDAKYVIIKPSGVDYEELTPDDMVVVDLEGNIVEGKLKPSSDTATHIELYKKYPEIGGIVHTHSKMAVSFASACRKIPSYNTTHGDYFYGDILCTRSLTKEEIEGEYEKNTGLVIIETLEKKNINPMHNPGILCANHGPFTWGKNASDAVHNSVVLEEVATMAFNAELLNKNIMPAPKYIVDKHFMRKHGPNAYYGQK
ncbi:MAG: L-ribulose-5-phosphate 4-epimerase [Clostridia bacterium]